MNGIDSKRILSNRRIKTFVGLTNPVQLQLVKVLKIGNKKNLK